MPKVSTTDVDNRKGVGMSSEEISIIGMTDTEMRERVSALHRNKKVSEVGFFRIDEWEVLKGIFDKIKDDRDASALLYYILEHVTSIRPPR